MASLLDIAPLRETVEVGGVSLELRPISAEAIVTLVTRFGNVLGVLSGEVAAIAPALKPAIGAVIAAANGELGHQKAEERAAELPVGDQVAILAAVRRLTMPKGARPFVQALHELGLPVQGFLDWLDGSPAAIPTASQPSDDAVSAASSTSSPSPSSN